MFTMTDQDRRIAADQSNRPWLLLDVDGVIDPYLSSNRRSHKIYHDGWYARKTWPFGYEQRVCINPVIRRWLRTLVNETNVELAWCTTWQAEANKWISPLLDLPDLPFVPNAVKDHKALEAVPWTGGRPFAWLDDVSGELNAAAALTAKRRQAFLPVWVNGREGLRWDDIVAVRTWLDRLWEVNDEHGVVHI